MSKLHRRLAAAFGPDRVIVRNPYHMQIAIDGLKVRHDIWPKRNGGLKWRLAGCCKVETGHPNTLIKEINSYVAIRGYARVASAVDRITRGIEIASGQATESGVARGVYCDAGFKGGVARISVVAVLGSRVEAWSDHVSAANINEAELVAICQAMQVYPEDVIYSDSRTAVRSVALDRVKWIPREQNKGADRMASLRRQS